MSHVNTNQQIQIKIILINEDGNLNSSVSKAPDTATETDGNFGPI